MLAVDTLSNAETAFAVDVSSPRRVCPPHGPDDDAPRGGGVEPVPHGGAEVLVEQRVQDGVGQGGAHAPQQRKGVADHHGGLPAGDKVGITRQFSFHPGCFFIVAQVQKRNQPVWYPYFNARSIVFPNIQQIILFQYRQKGALLLWSGATADRRMAMKKRPQGGRRRNN